MRKPRLSGSPRLRGWRRLTIAATIAAVAVTAAGGVAGARPERPLDATAAPACRVLHVPVDITTDTGPATMWSQLCVPRQAHRVQLLVHGASYTHTYWSMTPQEQYSYTLQAWRRGWATLAVDRPGHGQSTPVGPEQPAPQIVANALARLVLDLHRGRYGQRFDTVLMVGHSAGTAMTLYTVQNHPELAGQLAGVALTGMVHAPNLADVAVPAEVVHPANTEPRFADLPDGWNTTIPGTRQALWWSPSSPPQLAQQDEDTKDYWSTPELTGAREYWAQPTTAAFPPVLVLAGDEDQSFCGGDAPRGRCHDDAALLANEQGYFRAGTDLTAHLVPGAGHCLSWNAGASTYLLDWAARIPADR